MVERYLLKKSIIRPLHAYNQLKRIKTLELDPSDPYTAAAIKDFRELFPSYENFLIQKP